MDAWMRTEKRATAETTRRRPQAPHRLTFAAISGGAHGDPNGPVPSDLYLEATDPTGEVAPWFDDVWWMESLRRWGDKPLVIHILPSEAALLHAVVLHQVAMMSRVAPQWRAIGYGYSTEVNGDAAVERLATSAYHEVRLFDGVRPGTRNAVVPRHALRIEDLFGRVRRIERDLGATRPVLVRATSLPPVPAEQAAGTAREVDAARQACG